MLKLAELKRLVQHLACSEVRSLTYSEPGFSLRIVAGERPLAQPAPPASCAPIATQAPPAADEMALKSPLIGVFMAAHPSRPAARIEAGAQVRADEVLGLIRIAGGIYRTVRAPCSAAIIERVVDDGARVQYGTPLFRLRADRKEAA